MKVILYQAFTGGIGIISKLSKGHVSTRPHEHQHRLITSRSTGVAK